MKCILQNRVGIGFENQNGEPDLPKNHEKPATPPSLPSPDQASLAFGTIAQSLL